MRQNRRRAVTRCIQFLVILPWSALGVHADAPPTENPSSVPEHLIVVGGTLFFAADDGIRGRELWKVDLNGECTLAADIVAGPQGGDPERLVNVDGRLYFRAQTPEHGRELWFWDDSADTATMVDDIEPGPGSSMPEPYGMVNGRFLFSTDTTELGRDLWVAQLGVTGAAPLFEDPPWERGSLGTHAAIGWADRRWQSGLIAAKPTGYRNWFTSC